MEEAQKMAAKGMFKDAQEEAPIIQKEPEVPVSVP